MSDMVIELAERLLHEVFDCMDATSLVDVIWEYDSLPDRDEFAFDLFDIANYCVTEHDTLDDSLIEEWMYNNGLIRKESK